MGRPKSNGPYTPLGANYYLDDAILEAGEQAELLFVRCLAFLADSHSDGFITERQMRAAVAIGLRGVDKRIATLLEVGLITASSGGYVVRSYLKWNKSSEEIGKYLKRDRERKARVSGVDEGNSARNPDGIQEDSGLQSTTQHSTTQHSIKAPATPSLDRVFDGAWEHWPKKVERKQAAARFKIVARRFDADMIAAEIARFGDAYAATTERQFVPALGVWLNGERWTDELPQPRGADPAKVTPMQRAQNVQDIAARMAAASNRQEISS